MGAPLHVDDAIVLRATPFGESDLVVHLLARGAGRVGAFARGGRRSARRFPGGLEPFTFLRAEWRERRGSELAELSASTIERPHLGIRASLGRLAQAGYVVDLARELSRDHVPNGALFELVAAALGLLSEAEASPAVLRAYELQALSSAGFAPALDECPRCSTPAGRAGPLAFDAASGGVACARCAAPGAVPLTVDGLAMLKVLSVRPLDEVARASLPRLPDDLRGALQAFLGHHVHHQLRSLEFLRASGVAW